MRMVRAGRVRRAKEEEKKTKPGQDGKEASGLPR